MLIKSFTANCKHCEESSIYHEYIESNTECKNKKLNKYVFV